MRRRVSSGGCRQRTATRSRCAALVTILALIINLTIWESLDAMREFVFRDRQHLAVMRRRREWFERLDVHTTLWWVPAGHQPSVPEAEARLEHLRTRGPTAWAFTFRQHFAPDDASRELREDAWLCST